MVIGSIAGKIKDGPFEDEVSLSFSMAAGARLATERPRETRGRPLSQNTLKSERGKSEPRPPLTDPEQHPRDNPAWMDVAERPRYTATRGRFCRPCRDP